MMTDEDPPPFTCLVGTWDSWHAVTLGARDGVVEVTRDPPDVDRR